MSVKCLICRKWLVSDEKRVPHEGGYAHSYHFPSTDSNLVPPAPPPPPRSPQPVPPPFYPQPPPRYVPIFPQPPTIPPSQPPPSSNSWHCSFCSETNSSSLAVCGSCGVPPNYRFPEDQGTRWDCLVCFHQGNHWNSSHCAACTTPRGTPPPWSISPSAPSPPSPSLPDTKPPANPPLVASRSYEIRMDFTCIICVTEPRSHIFIPCFHLIYCANCVQKVIRGSSCAVCRGTIEDIKQVYLS